MKQKISVEIHKTGSENDVLLRLVGNMNEGLCKDDPISQSDLIRYFAVRNAMYPTIFSFSFQCEGDTLHVSEDKGKTFTLSLTWKEVEELATENGSDIPEKLFEQSPLAWDEGMK